MAAATFRQSSNRRSSSFRNPPAEFRPHPSHRPFIQPIESLNRPSFEPRTSSPGASTNLSGNTIFIAGGGSGIGLVLARQFHQRGNQVIIAGRGKANLDAATAANPGMKSIVLDTADPARIAAAVPKLVAEFPAMNVVINNAGIMRPEDLKQAKVADAEAIVATNLLGPIRIAAALLPHLLRHARR